jgi:hypothetical protein
VADELLELVGDELHPAKATSPSRAIDNSTVNDRFGTRIVNLLSRVPSVPGVYSMEGGRGRGRG